MSKLVAPSILSADFANLQTELDKLALAGADWVHVDVMDGHFVPNLTIGMPVVKALKKVTKLPLDVHLMITEPEKYIEEFVQSGSDYLTIHVEATKNVEKCLKQIRALGAKAGISVKPHTPVSEIEPYLELCDLILIMTVEPGFGGQKFMLQPIEKAERLKQIRAEKKLNYLIEVDGGISDETVKHCKSIDVLVAGSYVFKNDYREAIQKLKNG